MYILINRCPWDVFFLSPYLCASFTLSYCEVSLVYAKAKTKVERRDFLYLSPSIAKESSFALFSYCFLLVPLVWVVGAAFPCSRSTFIQWMRALNASAEMEREGVGPGWINGWDCGRCPLSTPNPSRSLFISRYLFNKHSSLCKSCLKFETLF